MKIYTTLSRLPIWNYYEVKEASNPKYLYIVENESDYDDIEIDESNFPLLNETWNNLTADFITHYAMNQEYMNRLMIEKRVMMMKLQYIETENGLLKNRIAVEESKLKENSTYIEKEVSLEETVGHVEKFMGFQIDIFKCPISKLHSYIKQMREIAEKNA